MLVFSKLSSNNFRPKKPREYFSIFFKSLHKPIIFGNFVGPSNGKKLRGLMYKQIQYVTQYVGRGFKNDELRQTKVIHFWKADGI